MPRHVVIMWLLAGGGTLVGATMAYLATRPAFSPVVSPASARARAGMRRIRGAMQKTARKLGLADKSLMFSGPDVSLSSRTSSFAQPYRNAAFEAYRAAELAKLDEEERDFQDYLQRLRDARDREEFNAFLEQGRARSGAAISRLGQQ